MRASLASSLAALTVAGLCAGCGGQGAATRRDTTRADAKLAAEIRDNARQHEQDRSAEEAAQGSDRMHVPAGDSLPAGSSEIDGASPAGPGTGGGTASSASHALFSSADRRSFAALSRSLGGQSGVAASGLGLGRPVQALGALRSAIAWSTSKVPVAMAVVAAGGAKAQQANLKQAITASDNAAAERLWASLGGGEPAARAADEQLRAAGDQRTQTQAQRLRAGFTPFGQTVWRLTDQARFTAGMACVPAGVQVLALMGQVIAAHRWGLGSVGGPPQLKGGWGPGTSPGVNGGYLDRQMGVLAIKGKRVAVTIATLPSDGSHGTGTAHLTTIARWVVSHIDVTKATKNARCG